MRRVSRVVDAAEAAAGRWSSLPPLYRSLRRLEDEGAVASRWCDEDVGPRRREYELTQQGVELAEQWLDALRARRRLDDLLVELLEGGLAELKRNDV